MQILTKMHINLGGKLGLTQQPMLLAALSETLLAFR